MDTFNHEEWYFNFDLKSGYLQEEMAEESIPLTALVSKCTLIVFKGCIWIKKCLS